MPREADGDSAVEEGAGDQGGEDAEGQIALGLFALFGGGGDGVEADVGEEDDGAAGEHAGPAVGHEGVPVDGLDEAGGGEDEGEDGDDLDQYKDVVGAGRLADAADQDDSENHDHEEGGNVEAEVPAGLRRGLCRRGPGGPWGDRRARSNVRRGGCRTIRGVPRYGRRSRR